MSFFQNTCRPEGLGGKMMVNMMNTGHAALTAWGLEHIEISESGDFLDVGCGGGAAVKRLLERSPRGRVTGIDYSDVSVETSKKVNRTEIEAGRCRILRGNVMALPFEAGSFGTVTAFETIYFWPDIAEAFREVYRILKDDGVFMICNECGGEKASDEKWTEKIQGMAIYRDKEIQAALRNAGFREIQADKNTKGWLCVTAKR